MPFKKAQVITFFAPRFCANCRRPAGDDLYKFTLVGTETRCAFLCNECFKRLYAEAAAKEKTEVKVQNGQRDKAKRVGQMVKNGSTLLEHIDNGEEQ